MKIGQPDNRRAPSVVTFVEAAGLDPSDLGAKAANLVRLASAGFPVPSGLVVTPFAQSNQEEVWPRLREAASELADEPQLLRRFDKLLELAQRYAMVREQQARSFTLGWPLLRRCVLRLGEMLVERGTTAEPASVFFLKKY